MRIIAELAGGIMLLAIFLIGIISVVKEMNKPDKPKETENANEPEGDVSGKGTKH